MVKNELLNVIKEIAFAPKSAFSIIQTIYLYRDSYLELRLWYKEITGNDLDIVMDALKIRDCARSYLTERGIEVPEDMVYTSEEFNTKSSGDYINNWDIDNNSMGKNR